MKIEYSKLSEMSYGMWKCPDCGSLFYGGGRPIHKTECRTKADYKDLVFLVGPEVIKAAKEWAEYKNDENAKAPLLPVSWAEIKAILPADLL